MSSEHLPPKRVLTVEEAADVFLSEGFIMFETQPDGTRAPVRYLQPEDTAQ